MLRREGLESGVLSVRSPPIPLHAAPRNLTSDSSSDYIFKESSPHSFPFLATFSFHLYNASLSHTALYQRSSQLSIYSLPLIRKQRRTARSSTFCHLCTHISQVLPLMSKLVKQSSSISLISFAYKHILKFYAQTFLTLTAQVLQFTLFHFAAQFTHILLPHSCLINRVFHS